eukprot:scaffold2752_cov106-Isochrysis_galbana.AAC.3
MAAMRRLYCCVRRQAAETTCARRHQVTLIPDPFNPLPSTLEQRPHGAALESSRGHSTQPIDIGGDSPLVTHPPWTK